MKTNFMKVAFVAAIAFVSSITVFNSLKPEIELSDIALANVEALADGESFVDDGTCYNTISAAAGSKVRYCGTCTFIENSIGTRGDKGTCW